MEKIKNLFAICVILLLFPYIIVTLAGHTTKVEDLELLEQWVVEILPGQMSVTYEPEALKAQAILVRSNLLYHMTEEGMGSGDMTSAHMDRWGMKGYSYLELQEIWGQEDGEVYYEKIHRAVEETCGKVLQLDGRYVDIPYHAVSAGSTRSGELLGEEYAYLQAVDCPGELEADNFLTVSELFLDEPEIISRDAFGYVTELRVGGVSQGGEEFRQKYRLPSSCFTFTENVQAGTWTASVKGLGHGFGMSMYQAQRMAQQGMSCFDILEYFYEALTLDTVSKK